MIDTKSSDNLYKVKELFKKWHPQNYDRLASISQVELAQLFTKSSHIKRLLTRGQAEPKFKQQVIDDFDRANRQI